MDSEATTLQAFRNGFKEDFKKRLEGWTTSPYCDIHHYRAGAAPCHCRARFVRLKPLQEWLEDRAPQSDGPKSNKELLLEAVRPIKATFATPRAIIDNEHQRSVLVLCCLFMVDYTLAHLVELFCESGITDRSLSEQKIDYTDFRRLLSDARSEDHRASYDEDAVNELIRKFDADRWAFCPAELSTSSLDGKPYLNGRKFDKNVRLPFCSRKRFDQKGGTAELLNVVVQKDFVPCDWRSKLGNPFNFGVNSENFRQNYGEATLKVYSSARQQGYYSESIAFKGLQDKEGILRSIGSFSQFDGEPYPEGRNAFYVVLEWAQQDLTTFFDRHQPPCRTHEIITFWKSICKLSRAIKLIHKFTHAETEYVGSHGDIKPDNILQVGGTWKLADFGFAEFLVNKPNLTSAPGFPSEAIPVDQIQARDVWAFGCVLSVAATWVIGGPNGLKEYSDRRGDVSEERKKAKPDDAFHDGTKVYPEIRHWHEDLKKSMRKSDPITNQVLDLVQDRILVNENRIKSADLCEALDSIINSVENKCSDAENKMPKAKVNQPLDRSLHSSLYATELQRILESKEDSTAIPTPTDRHFRKLLRARSNARNVGREEKAGHREHNPGYRSDPLTGVGAAPVAAYREESLRPWLSVNVKFQNPSLTLTGKKGETRFVFAGSEMRELDSEDEKRSNASLEEVIEQPRPSVSDKAMGKTKVAEAEPGKQRSLDEGENILSDAVMDSQHYRHNLDAGTSIPAAFQVPNSPSHIGQTSGADHRAPSRAQIATPQPITGCERGIKENDHKIFRAVALDEEDSRHWLSDILSADPSTPMLRNNKGQTAIMVAAHHFNLTAIEILLTQQATSEPPGILAQDERGRTVLHLLIASRAKGRGRELPERHDAYEKTLEKLVGSPDGRQLVNLQDENLHSPLVYSVWQGSCTLRTTMETLCDNGADLNPKPSAVVLAVKNGLLDAFKLLIDREAKFSRDEVSRKDLSAAMDNYLKDKEGHSEGSKGKKKSFKEMFKKNR
ncbi:MAG: hypothetical protein M1820_007593 [Bogoriella megaspora]|nr:MAG: hypothetical protein M1820_007593 [Bogoriella megaspora]